MRQLSRSLTEKSQERAELMAINKDLSAQVRLRERARERGCVCVYQTDKERVREQQLMDESVNHYTYLKMPQAFLIEKLDCMVE